MDFSYVSLRRKHSGNNNSWKAVGNAENLKILEEYIADKLQTEFFYAKLANSKILKWLMYLHMRSAGNIQQ